uniref:Uncharacterized protein n=1 Tax=Candidatus Kentrum sp. FM TaxID=2126340 RepID=A0A450WGG7_9GAMM|nr:MAG: hypothetical protein BECKFM1743B_GA0114221_104071 [Candidatus Kentron sp. FM]
MRLLSTPESVADNQPTVLAIVETVLAVAIYWGVAWAFDTHWHLLVSISVAPLLLLRSKESTALGVRWFVAYWKEETEITREDTPGRFWGLVLLAGGISGVCFYGLADTLLVGQVGWALFFRAFGVGVLASMMGVMAAAAVAVAVAVPAAGALALAAALAGALAGAGALAVAVAVVGAVVVAGAVAVAGAGAGAGAVLLGLPFWVSLAAGIWLRSLGMRILATLFHPVRGIKELPANWRRMLLAMDSAHAPELVPGLSAKIEGLSLPGFVEDIRAGDWGERLVAILLIPIWFLPGLLYRWSLKSTCWLYLPLIYLGGGLRRRGLTPEGKGLLVMGLHKSHVEGLRRALAMGVAVSLVITTAVHYSPLQAAIEQSLAQFPAALKFLLWLVGLLTESASNLAYLWRFNLIGLDIAPWQWLNLLGAALTFILYFYSDRVHRAWELAQKPDATAAPSDVHVGRLLMLTRLRNLCVSLYLPLAFGYVALALEGIDPAALTGWLAPLGVLVGPYL